ncbi:oxytocin receptor-like [Paramacrobiotus metropolitanus]|uniref:oxytocin receptor-like n=1 Tax=Paramacrobiotus metropolitanus TaxID=2943436 RepID=UPI0024460092|nr:oxytocin receptor-like [Paramacrobiotus metropolitanus]
MDNDSVDYNYSIMVPGIMTRDEELAKVEIGILGAIFAVALFGNISVLSILLWRRKKLTRMYFFIFHLSMADLIVAFFNILPQMAWDITWRFQGNDMGCKVVKFFQVFALYLSTWVLVMMAIDRHAAICSPMNAYNWRARRCTMMIVYAWILSVVCSLPQIFIFSQMEVYPGVQDCWATFISPWGNKAYVLWFAGSIYVIPLIILCITYGQVSWTIWQTMVRHKHNGSLRLKQQRNGTSALSRAPSGSSHNHFLPDTRTHSTYKRGQSFTRAKLRTVKLTMVVIVAYLICWTPFFVALLWTTFFPDTAYVSEPAFVILLLLANLNSCSNPWIYLFFSLSRYFRCIEWCLDRLESEEHKRLRAVTQTVCLPSSSGASLLYMYKPAGILPLNSVMHNGHVHSAYVHKLQPRIATTGM